MPKPLERVYLASCPFCGYRELFASEIMMFVVYGTHLSDHEGEAVEEGRHGRTGPAPRMEAVARHLQRLNTAREN